MNNTAIDTASRFGDIPFVEFTKDLVTGVFDSLVEVHVLQMEEYASFVGSLTQDLSTYINNTQDGVTFDQVSDFILNFELPEVEITELTNQLDLLTLESADSTSPGLLTKEEQLDPTDTTDFRIDKWWTGLIDALSPAINNLIDKIDDPSEHIELERFKNYNDAVLRGADITSDIIPTYGQIYDAVAALIVSNKYGLLQTMAKQGVMRLVVTEGEIETKLTFSTWNTSSSGTETKHRDRNRISRKAKDVKGGGIIGFFRKKRKRKTTSRMVTVNTAKSYQRDSSGTKVDIFGRVLIKFKSDYAPLNG